MENKKIAIVQSNYIPWKGYFDIINSVDEFVILDEVQYTRRDWRNRNLIKTARGLQWLSIPVNVKGNFLIPINEVRVAEPGWAEQHWKTIVSNYKKAAFFSRYEGIFSSLYSTLKEDNLSMINYRFISAINSLLQIKTRITFSTNYFTPEGKNERLINICKQAKASNYLSGPSARNYIDEAMFLKEGITVEWMGYNDYKEYPQLFPPFQHGVTVLDLIFNTGANAKKFLKSHKD